MFILGVTHQVEAGADWRESFARCRFGQAMAIKITIFHREINELYMAMFNRFQ